MTNDPNGKKIPLRHLTEALDEIYMLRAHVAKEAQRIRSEEIPRARSHKRRAELLALAERFEDAAAGNAEQAWKHGENPARFLRLAGADDNLNYSAWLETKQTDA